MQNRFSLPILNRIAGLIGLVIFYIQVCAQCPKVKHRVVIESSLCLLKVNINGRASVADLFSVEYLMETIVSY